MKNLLLIILTWSISTTLLAQVVKHHNYCTHYNAAIKEPDSVVWDLTPAMVGCTDQTRKNAFKQDPEIPGSATPTDYAVNSGNTNRPAWIDEGHLFSYQDAMCNDIDKVECFYMSNMLPQYHAFNAGDWKTLEVQERVWAKTGTLHIIAGGIGSVGKLPNCENIPAFFFKAIYMNGQWTAWIMPNAVTSVKHVYSYWEKPVSVLNAETGLKL